MIKNIIKNYFSDKYRIKIFEFISLLFNFNSKRVYNKKSFFICI